MSDYTKQVQLSHKWVFYYDEKTARGLQHDRYKNSLKKLSEFDTLLDFWKYYKFIDVANLPASANLRLFKTGIEPTWEDPANQAGGKFILDLPSGLPVTGAWTYTILTMIGEHFSLSHQICGAVLSHRGRHGTSINIWTRSTLPQIIKTCENDLDTILIPKLKELVEKEAKQPINSGHLATNLSGSAPSPNSTQSPSTSLPSPSIAFRFQPHQQSLDWNHLWSTAKSKENYLATLAAQQQKHSTLPHNLNHSQLLSHSPQPNANGLQSNASHSGEVPPLDYSAISGSSLSLSSLISPISSPSRAKKNGGGHNRRGSSSGVSTSKPSPQKTSSGIVSNSNNSSININSGGGANSTSAQKSNRRSSQPKSSRSRNALIQSSPLPMTMIPTDQSILAANSNLAPSLTDSESPSGSPTPTLDSDSSSQNQTNNTNNNSNGDIVVSNNESTPNLPSSPLTSPSNNKYDSSPHTQQIPSWEEDFRSPLLELDDQDDSEEDISPLVSLSKMAPSGTSQSSPSSSLSASTSSSTSSPLNTIVSPTPTVIFAQTTLGKKNSSSQDSVSPITPNGPKSQNNSYSSSTIVPLLPLSPSLLNLPTQLSISNPSPTKSSPPSTQVESPANNRANLVLVPPIKMLPQDHNWWKVRSNRKRGGRISVSPTALSTLLHQSIQKQMYKKQISNTGSSNGGVRTSPDSRSNQNSLLARVQQQSQIQNTPQTQNNTQQQFIVVESSQQQLTVINSSSTVIPREFPALPHPWTKSQVIDDNTGVFTYHGGTTSSGGGRKRQRPSRGGSRDKSRDYTANIIVNHRESASRDLTVIIPQEDSQKEHLIISPLSSPLGPQYLPTIQSLGFGNNTIGSSLTSHTTPNSSDGLYTPSTNSSPPQHPSNNTNNTLSSLILSSPRSLSPPSPTEYILTQNSRNFSSSPHSISTINSNLAYNVTLIQTQPSILSHQTSPNSHSPNSTISSLTVVENTTILPILSVSLDSTSIQSSESGTSNKSQNSNLETGEDSLLSSGTLPNNSTSITVQEKSSHHRRPSRGRGKGKEKRLNQAKQNSSSIPSVPSSSQINNPNDVPQISTTYVETIDKPIISVQSTETLNKEKQNSTPSLRPSVTTQTSSSKLTPTPSKQKSKSSKAQGQKLNQSQNSISRQNSFNRTVVMILSTILIIFLGIIIYQGRKLNWI